MEVIQKKQDELTSVLTINLNPEDYQTKVQQSLSNQAKNASIKGFRKGKVPSNLVKKMYGNAILADVINNEVNQGINNFLTENKLEVLGQPIPVADDALDFDIYNPTDYSFQYKIGLKPSIDLSYLDDSPTYTGYEIEITDEMIQKEVEHFLENYGDIENPEGQPDGKDAIEVKLTELDENGETKAEGYEHTTTFGFDQLKLKKDQKAIGKLAVGDIYAPFNVYKAFDKEKDAIAKQVLELDNTTVEEVGGSFALQLMQINRVKKGELNQAFFDKLYGEGIVKSEEEMKEKIKENLTNYFSQATENQLKNDIYKDLIEKSKGELPEDFLKEWLLITRENKDEVSEEDVENEFPTFSQNLRTSLVFNAVAERGELQVSYEELIDRVKSNLIQQFQQYGLPLNDNEEMLNGMVQRFMSDEKQVRQTQDQILDDKIFNYLKENVKVEPKSISLEDFNDLNQEK